jgi:hypothetical protein
MKLSPISHLKREFQNKRDSINMHRDKMSAHAHELNMANILNIITRNKTMAIYSLDMSDTNKKIQKTGRLNLNHESSNI